MMNPEISSYRIRRLRGQLIRKIGALGQEIKSCLDQCSGNILDCGEEDLISTRDLLSCLDEALSFHLGNYHQLDGVLERIEALLSPPQTEGCVDALEESDESLAESDEELETEAVGEVMTESEESLTEPPTQEDV